MADYGKMDDWQLGRRRHQLIQEMGELEEEMNKRRAQDRHIMKKDEWQWEERSGIGMQVPQRAAPLVNPMLGFNCYNFNAFVAERPPGSQFGAYHMHGEAIKYYLSGKGVEIIGDKRYEVEAGDVGFIPAHVWHGTQNTGSEPLRFLAVVQGTGTPLLKPIVFRIREDLREG